MKAKMTTKQLVQIAMIAAIYAVLTAIFSSISFTPLQLRLSEIMVFLAYFNPIYIIGLTLGCFIVNILMSPYLLMDGVFGTLATLLSVSAIYYTAKAFKGSKKGLIVASIWPTIVNGLIVGWVIYTCSIAEGSMTKNLTALIGLMGNVAFGEFIVVTIIGVPVVYFIMSRYQSVINKITK
ncbi:QueT transporter family protein [Cellulosilyticum ruminicola]|uniref:QueT transporter family protein n=1 Tax=Cellulosilyticum ruminicola TaxID=425254 RepID=UPI0006CF3A91|nr:QueT transporter family protein [Cellulosilyticum ruminicola]